MSKGKRCVVSLTTIPDRVNLLSECLNSLDNQSLKPSQIYLQIPKTTLSGKRFDLSLLKKIHIPSSVKINIIDKDYGPITKLIPVLELEKDPDTYIIIVDDDIIYHKDLIKTLCNPKHDAFDAIGLAGRTESFEFVANDALMGSGASFIKVDHPTQVWMLEAFAGVRVRRGVFPQNVNVFIEWMNNVLKIEQKCIYTDDIILGLWYESFQRTSSHPPVIPVIIVAPDITHKFNDKDTPKLGTQNLGEQGRNIVCLSKFKKYSPSPWYRKYIIDHPIFFWYFIALLLILIVYISDCMILRRGKSLTIYFT
jgi:hypothetical protein